MSFNAEQCTVEKTAASVVIQQLMSSALWRAGTRESGLVRLSTAGRSVCNNYSYSITVSIRI
jgi:hypothetical protein